MTDSKDLISLYLPSQKQEGRRSVHPDNGTYEGWGGWGVSKFAVCLRA